MTFFEVQQTSVETAFKMHFMRYGVGLLAPDFLLAVPIRKSRVTKTIMIRTMDFLVQIFPCEMVDLHETVNV